jgi:UDP:flavonoid glycosyltransferase YjiC (YdhE family)
VTLSIVHASQVAGYCHAPAQNYQPPPQLQQFLEAGPPPVYFGFGSMPVNKPEVTRCAGTQC